MDIPQVKTSKSHIAKVINDRVLIDPEEPEFTNADKAVSDALTKGKLVLPEEYAGLIKKSPEWGKIVSWGDKCTYKWQYGMRVHFARMASAKVQINGNTLHLVREYDIDLYEIND